MLSESMEVATASPPVSYQTFSGVPERMATRSGFSVKVSECPTQSVVVTGNSDWSMPAPLVSSSAACVASDAVVALDAVVSSAELSSLVEQPAVASDSAATAATAARVVRRILISHN